MSPDLPKVVLPNGRDCVDLADFTSDTLQLDSDVGSSLNDLICVVRVLGRRGIAVKFDIRGNHLLEREHVAVCFQPIQLTVLVKKTVRGPISTKIPVAETLLTMPSQTSPLKGLHTTA